MIMQPFFSNCVLSKLLDTSYTKSCHNQCLYVNNGLAAAPFFFLGELGFFAALFSIVVKSRWLYITG